MKKILLILLLLFPISVYSLDYPEVLSKKVEIYDLKEKKIYYEIASHERASIASLTKIATTLTAIESISNLEEQVTITSSILNTVPWDASVAGLKVGDVLTYRDLLYASMLPSGADATNSLAIHSSGSIENFVEKMNELASNIGLTNTHFVNVMGYDDANHYSTVDDVRKLLEYALENPLFREIYTTKEYRLSNGLLVKSTLYKYRTDSSSLEKILGSKTGYTKDAGYCLSALSNINGHEMIFIVLNAPVKNNRYYNIIDTTTYIDFMKEHYKEEILVYKDTLIKKIPTTLSSIETYELYADKDILKYLPSDYEKSLLKIEYEGLEKLSFRNKKGSKIGTIHYSYGEEDLYQQDVILEKKIDLSIQKVLETYYLWIIGFLFLLFLIHLILFKKRKNK